MRVFRDLSALTREARGGPSRPRVATVGYFDGLHVGHQKLLGELSAWTREIGGESAVVTFDRHPLEILEGRRPLKVLSLAHRLLLLERQGVEVVLLLEFTRELSTWSPEDFATKVFRDALGARHILMGFDAALGHERRGTFEYLSSRAGALGIVVRRASVEVLGGERVSSTIVRKAIQAGDLPALEKVLARRFSLLGRVVRGDGRGRSIGFPTANLDLEGAALVPGGVYFAEVTRLGRPSGPESLPRCGGAQRLPAVVNVGTCPTFGKGGAADTVEVHIPDFHGDLYGEYLEVHFLLRHREERKFPSAALLVDQIRADVDACREFLAGVPRQLPADTQRQV